MLLGTLAKVVHVNIAVLVGLHDHHLHPGHHRAGRVGAVGGLRNEADVPLALTAGLVVRLDHLQTGELALRARVRLQRDAGEPGYLRKLRLESLEQLRIPGRLLARRKRMNPAELAPGDRNHLRGSVQLHGAGAERDHGVHERQVLLLEAPHVAQHLGLGPVRVEHGVLHERGGALERSVEARIHLRSQVIHRELGRAAAVEQLEQRLHLFRCNRLVEGYSNGSVLMGAQVDATRACSLDEGGSVLSFEPDGVEERVVRNRPAQLTRAGRKHQREVVDALRNAPQSGRTVVNGVHARHHGQQHLRGANVGRRLLAPDVLLSSLQCHAQRRAPLGIA